MKVYSLCPVSEKAINENVARINGIFTFLLLIIYLVSQSIYPVIILAADFLLRASDYGKYSLFTYTSKQLIQVLNIKSQMINAGPKIFAARIGFLFSIFIIITAWIQFPGTSLFFAGMLGIFSFLEGFFGICVACMIYPFFYRLLKA